MFYKEVSDKFEPRVLALASKFQYQEENETPNINTSTYSFAIQTRSQIATERSSEERKNEDLSHSKSMNKDKIRSSVGKDNRSLTDGNSNRSKETILEVDIALPEPSKREINIHLSEGELSDWISEYAKDKSIGRIIDEIKNEQTLWNPKYPQYFLSDQGLLYFEDWEGNLRLYVPEGLRIKILKEDHEQLTNGAHSGALRMYGRLTNTYYWPKMMRDIKAFCGTCDVCQKVKHRRHGPYGMLEPLPIPSRPF